MFDIIHDVCNAVTLVQLVETLWNIINTCSKAGVFIFDTKHKKELPLRCEYLDMICSSTDKTSTFEISINYLIKYGSCPQNSNELLK